MVARDMVNRNSPQESDDFIPTPPYATRALYEFVAPELKEYALTSTVLDPSAGAGHMLRVFKEYRHLDVWGSDLNDHGAGMTITTGVDYRKCPIKGVDYIITNPPYKHLNEFIEKALDDAKLGVSMLVRVQALESQSRYEIFKKHPPTQVAFFSDRIPFKSGVVVRRAPKMFFHTWLWWNKLDSAPRPPMWLPPGLQGMLEKPHDYK